MKKIFYLLCLIILHGCSGNDNSKNNISPEVAEQFPLVADNTNFRENSENSLGIGYAGEISFRNNSGMVINDEQLNNGAYLEFSFDDGDIIDIPMITFCNKKGKWLPNEVIIFTTGNGSLTENVRTLLSERDFNKTPNRAVLNMPFTMINVDKEINFPYVIDILPKWKAFQTLKGIR